MGGICLKLSNFFILSKNIYVFYCTWYTYLANVIFVASLEERGKLWKWLTSGWLKIYMRNISTIVFDILRFQCAKFIPIVLIGKVTTNRVVTHIQVLNIMHIWNKTLPYSQDPLNLAGGKIYLHIKYLNNDFPPGKTIHQLCELWWVNYYLNTRSMYHMFKSVMERSIQV